MKITKIANRKLDHLYRNFEWITLGLLIFLLLIPKFQLIPVSGTYVNIRIEDFVVTIVYGLWLVGLIAGYYTLRSIFNYRIVIFFIIYGLLITLLGITVFGTVKTWHLGILHWLRRAEYLGMYFLAASVLKRKNLEKYLHILLTVGIVTWIYGVLQWKNLVPGVHTLSKSGQLGTYRELGYVISTFAAHYDFGAFLIFMVMLSLWGYFNYKPIKTKMFFAGLILSFWWMALLAYARAAYLGLLISSLFVLVVKLSPWAFLPLWEIFNTFNRYLGGKLSLYSYNFRLKIRPTPKPTLAPTPTPTPHAGLLTPTPKISPTPATRVILSPTPYPTAEPRPSPSTLRVWLDGQVNKWSGKLTKHLGEIDINLDPSANIRLKEWPERFSKVGYHFLWGGGYYTAGLGTDNDYLRHLVEVGVIGLSVFLLLLWDFVRLSWRMFRKLPEARERNFHLIIIGFIIGLLVEAIFIDIFAASKIAFLLWFLMGTVSLFAQEIPVEA